MPDGFTYSGRSSRSTATLTRVVRSSSGRWRSLVGSARPTSSDVHFPVATSQALESGDVAEAKKLYQEALDMARETNDRVALARSLVFLAERAPLETGDWAVPRNSSARPRPIITLQIGFPALTARLEIAEGTLDVARGRLPSDVRHLEAGLDIARDIGRDRAIVDADAALAALDLLEDDERSAGKRLAEAAELARGPQRAGPCGQDARVAGAWPYRFTGDGAVRGGTRGCSDQPAVGAQRRRLNTTGPPEDCGSRRSTPLAGRGGARESSSGTFTGSAGTSGLGAHRRDRTALGRYGRHRRAHRRPGDGCRTGRGVVFATSWRDPGFEFDKSMHFSRPARLRRSSQG